MKQVAEYRRNAAECARLARRAVSDKERQQLLDLAKTWEALAIDREAMIHTHPALHAQLSVLDKETAKTRGGSLGTA